MNEASRKHRGGKTLLWCLILPVLLVPVLLLLIQAPIGDEALFVLFARLAHLGLVPYRDFFFCMMTGSVGILTPVFAVTGISMTAARLMILGLLCAAGGSVLTMGKAYLPKWALGALGLFLWVGVVENSLFVSHHSMSGALGTLAVFFGWRHLKRQQPGDLIVCGAMTAMTLWVTTQSLGALMLAGMSIFWVAWFRWGRPQTAHPVRTLLMCFGLPILLFLGLNLLDVWRQGLWDIFWQDTILYLAGGEYLHTTETGYFSTGLAEILSPLLMSNGTAVVGIRWENLPMSILTALIGGLPILGVVWGIERCIRMLLQQDRTERFWETGLLVVAATAMAISTLSYSTGTHIAMDGWPGYLLAALALQHLLTKKPVMKKTLVIGVGLVCVYVSGYRTWQLWQYATDEKRWIASYGTTEPWLLAGPQWTDNVFLASVVVEWIRQESGPADPVFVLNASPELYLLADRQPAARYLWPLPPVLNRHQTEEMTRDIAAHAPKIIVKDHRYDQLLAGDPRFAAYRKKPPRFDGLQALLAKNYDRMPKVGRYTLYRRKEERNTSGAFR